MDRQHGEHRRARREVGSRRQTRRARARGKKSKGKGKGKKSKDKESAALLEPCFARRWMPLSETI